MDILKLILTLLARLADLGLPPGPSDEPAFRAWIKQLSDIMAMVAALSATPVDDNAVKLLNLAATDDEVWAIVYAIITDLSSDKPMGTEIELAALSEKTAIDPATLLAIIQAVMEIIAWWRNRKA